MVCVETGNESVEAYLSYDECLATIKDERELQQASICDTNHRHYRKSSENDERIEGLFIGVTLIPKNFKRDPEVSDQVRKDIFLGNIIEKKIVSFLT